MSKTFARSSLCALTMTIMNAHAAEPPTNLDKPEGDWILSPGRDTSNADKLINNTTG